MDSQEQLGFEIAAWDAAKIAYTDNQQYADFEAARQGLASLNQYVLEPQMLAIIESIGPALDGLPAERRYHYFKRDPNGKDGLYPAGGYHVIRKDLWLQEVGEAGMLLLSGLGLVVLIVAAAVLVSVLFAL